MPEFQGSLLRTTNKVDPENIYIYWLILYFVKKMFIAQTKFYTDLLGVKKC